MGAPDTGRDTERDEELRLPPASRSGAKLATLVVAAALLAAGVVARFAPDRHESPRELARSVTSQAESSAIASMPAERLGELVALHSNPAVCPPTIECTRSASLPAASVRAVNRYVPRIVVRHTIAVTQTNPPRVYYRQLVATGGDLLVSVQVTRSDIMDGLASRSYSRVADGLILRFVRFVTPANYEVVIEASGRPGRTTSLAALRALAADPALLALS